MLGITEGKDGLICFVWSISSDQTAGLTIIASHCLTLFYLTLIDDPFLAQALRASLQTGEFLETPLTGPISLPIDKFVSDVMRRLLSRLLPFLLLSLPLTSAQADDQLDCPESALTTYLVSLIDTLYNHGLTSFEQLIASLSETDSGYSLLDSWLSAGTFTLLAPTDAAFQAANLYPPFTGMSETDMANLAALHTLAGTWTYDKLPESPMHGIASTSLKIQGYMNSSTGSGAEQAMVLQQGEGGAVSVRMAGGNGTTWSGPIDLGGKGLNNIMVLPVDAVDRSSSCHWPADLLIMDQVVGFPPNLSTALTLPTTSRSANGLSNMAAALGSNGGAAKLEALTPNGFTAFVPVDDAWTAQVKALMNDSSSVATLLSNHVCSLFIGLRLY